MADYQDDWLKRIEEKLDRIGMETAQLPPLRQRLDEHIDRDEQLFYGDGNGAPGLIKDVDRIKQWRGSLRWLTGLMGAIATGAAAELARTVWWGK